MCWLKKGRGTAKEIFRFGFGNVNFVNSPDMLFQIATLRSTITAKWASEIPYFVMHMLDVGIEGLPLVVLFATFWTLEFDSFMNCLDMLTKEIIVLEFLIALSTIMGAEVSCFSSMNRIEMCL